MSKINSKVIDRLMKIGKTAELARNDFDVFENLKKSKEMKFNVNCLSDYTCDKFVNLSAMVRMKGYALKLAKLEKSDDVEIANTSINIKYLCGILMNQVRISGTIESMYDALEQEIKNIKGDELSNNENLFTDSLNDFNKNLLRYSSSSSVNASFYDIIDSIKEVQACRFEEEASLKAFQDAFVSVGETSKEDLSFAESKLSRSKIELEEAECLTMDMVVKGKSAMDSFVSEFSVNGVFDNEEYLRENYEPVADWK